MRRRVLMNATLAVVLLPIGALIFARELFVPAFIVTLAVHSVAALATFLPRSQIWGPARLRFAPADRAVWLTIDDGPADDTTRFLEILRRYDAKATFFVVGRAVERSGDAVRRIAEAGHEVACHTHSHPSGWFWAYRRDAIRREIDRCNEAIEAQTQRRVRRFRPPVGFRNGWAHDVLDEKGLELISWSRRGFDGIEGRDVDEIVGSILRGVQPGDILMIHQGRPSSVAILERLLEALRQRGLTCVVPEPSSRA